MPANVTLRAGPRQREILEQLALARTDAEIAARLGISVATVRTYLVRLYRDNQIANRTAAVALWLASQLLGDTKGSGNS